MRLQDFKEKYEKLCGKCNLSGQKALEAVKQNGDALMYVNEQTEQICLEAVKQYGYALRFVNEQTEQICLEAVKQNGCALRFVNEQTEQICLEAVKQYGYALRYVNEQMFDKTNTFIIGGKEVSEDTIKMALKEYFN